MNTEDPLLKAIYLNNEYDDPVWFVSKRKELPDNQEFWQEVYNELLRIRRED